MWTFFYINNSLTTVFKKVVVTGYLLGLWWRKNEERLGENGIHCQHFLVSKSLKKWILATGILFQKNSRRNAIIFQNCTVTKIYISLNFLHCNLYLFFNKVTLEKVGYIYIYIYRTIFLAVFLWNISKILQKAKGRKLLKESLIYRDQPLNYKTKFHGQEKKYG